MMSADPETPIGMVGEQSRDTEKAARAEPSQTTTRATRRACSPPWRIEKQDLVWQAAGQLSSSTLCSCTHANLRTYIRKPSTWRVTMVDYSNPHEEEDRHMYKSWLEYIDNVSAALRWDRHSSNFVGVAKTPGFWKLMLELDPTPVLCPMYLRHRVAAAAAAAALAPGVVVARGATTTACAVDSAPTATAVALTPGIVVTCVLSHYFGYLVDIMRE